MRVVHTTEGSVANAHGHLQGLVLNDDFLYTLLEPQGSSMAERTTLYLAMLSVFHVAILETDTYGEEWDLPMTYLIKLLSPWFIDRQIRHCRLGTGSVLLAHSSDCYKEVHKCVPLCRRASSTPSARVFLSHHGGKYCRDGWVYRGL
jgi:hypothetical protein